MKPVSHRMATWWMHWNDLNWPDGDNLDKIKARAEGFAKANVSAAMFFGAHFRWDFLPYFTQLHDYIGTVAEQLHQYGIKLFDHHSVSLVHRYDTVQEMRRVMNDSGPHLPFCPSREAAKSWAYKGQRLNDWRMIDVQNGAPLYFPQYTAEGFCHRNPDFKKAYQNYAKELIQATGIDGLSADDAMYFMHFNACGCEHCRAEFRERTGMELPPVEDRSFWGNWDNEAWHHWIDLRNDAAGEFYRDLRAILPEDFVLTGCGANSAAPLGVMAGSDARTFLQGWNYVNMEMSGNTPPYKHDKLTVNRSIPTRLVNSSHHQAAAREKGVRAFCTGFAHSTENANLVWATSKILGADAWIGTLKARLGLPWHILDTLPNEQDIVGTAFGFEAAHPELYGGNLVGQVGVFYSYETRNHSFYGCLEKGSYKDYSEALKLLFSSGISAHTVFAFPEDATIYPVIMLSGVAKMLPQEIQAMEKYLAAGGRVIALGPTPLSYCKHNWKLPSQTTEDIFTTVPDGIHVQRPEVWKSEVPITEQIESWQTPIEGLYYHSQRLCEENKADVLSLVDKFKREMPVQVTHSQGYLCATAEDENGITVQFLAADYDVDIDHRLDAMRTHRSRVNLLTTITPIEIDRKISIQASGSMQIYTPFNTEPAQITQCNNSFEITLPENCAYAVCYFPKEG